MEAVIAAVYLDAGFDRAREVILRLWGARLTAVETDARDAKTALQEWAQARGLAPPSYVEVARTGPDHAPTFTVEARLDNGETARAEARVKAAGRTIRGAAVAGASGRLGAAARREGMRMDLDGRTVLIVLAHPEPASFTAGWARASADAARAAGARVIWSDPQRHGVRPGRGAATLPGAARPLRPAQGP